MVNLSPIEYSWHRKHASINETVILGRSSEASGRLPADGAEFVSGPEY